MGKQDYLMALITSLSPAERRYFKLFSELQSGEKKYVQLFELLERDETGSNALLCKKLNITAPQLASLKYYLNEALLICLRSSREHQTDIDKLRTQVEEAHLLTGRRLFGYALDITEKALAKAWELEQFEMIYDLLKYKRTAMQDMGRFAELQERFAEYKKLDSITSELNELAYLNNLSALQERQRESLSGFKKIMQHPLLKTEPEKLQSVRAQVTWFLIWADYIESKNSTPRERLDFARKMWNFYNKKPQIKVISGMAYVICYTRIIYAEAIEKNTKRSYQLMNELEVMLDTGEIQVTKAKAASVKAYIYNLRMTVLQMDGMFEQMLTELKNLRPLIKQRSVFEQMEAAFYEAVALVNLQRGVEAAAKLNELLQMNLPVRTPVMKDVRALLVLAQIDMGNYDLVPYLIKSAKLWMKRNKYTDEEYNLFYTIIADAAKPTFPEKKQQAYARLMAAIDAGKMDSINENISLRFWLEKKMRSKGQVE